jgi:hypothetical protein
MKVASLKMMVWGGSALATVVLAAPAMAQAQPQGPALGSPASSTRLGNPAAGQEAGQTDSAVEATETEKKRRKNAPNKEGQLDKGDKYSFDDNAGVKVKMDAKTSEKEMAEFTHCLAKYRPDQALTYLGTLQNSKEAKKAMKPMLEEQCISRQLFNLTILELDEVLLRSSLFDALYNKRYDTLLSASFSTLPPADYAQEIGVTAAELPKVTAFQRKLGDCIVRQSAAEVHSLLAVSIWSDDEPQKVAAVTPAMQNCLPAGFDLKLSKTVFRGMLAESLFKFNNRLGQNTALVTQ